MIAAAAWHGRQQPVHPLLIAPAIGNLDGCFFAGESGAPLVDPLYRVSCDAEQGSAAAMLEATLAPLAATTRAGDVELGYTLVVPLLRFLQPTSDGTWNVDASAVARVVRTIRDLRRPVVLYLFSNHFSTAAPLEAILSHDPANLLQSAAGAMPVDSYYGAPIYPWSFVRKDNGITRAREAAVRAILDAVCRLPVDVQARIAGVTLLGETHHMFPQFETGMGYAGPYTVSDYSPSSRDGFQKFLQERFQTVAEMNRLLGSDYVRFDDVQLPSKNIRTQPLLRYDEHVDAFAAGILPVAGWVHLRPGDAAQSSAWIRVYRDGEQVARVQARFGRQDVLAAHPEFGSADLGWNVDLTYSRWKPGIHRIDVVLEGPARSLLRLASRDVSVMERTQPTPRRVVTRPMPALAAPGDDVVFHVDQPVDQMSLYFNPLVPLWNEFRAAQVRGYLQYFSEIVGQTCIGRGRVYSHQIVPFVNPGWDADKFGVGADLSVPADMRLGISLYGEASYGSSFADWFSHSGRGSYGITEFHPLKPMSPDDLRTLLDRHRANGMQFLSFFMDAAGHGERNSAVENPFVFDASNTHFGSDVLFRSMKTVLQGQ